MSAEADPDHAAPRPRHRVRVRYAETDCMRVAHHSSYIVWFEEARTEWMRSRGYTYRQMEERGVMLPIVEVQCTYIRSVRYDDVLEIETSLAELGRASVTLAYDVFLEGSERLVARGSTKLASCRMADGRPCRMPEDFVELMGRADPTG